MLVYWVVGMVDLHERMVIMKGTLRYFSTVSFYSLCGSQAVVSWVGNKRGVGHVPVGRGEKAMRLNARKKSAHEHSTDDGKGASPNHAKTVPHDGEFSYTTEVKKSKFVAFAWHVSSEEEAMKLISNVRDPSASHTCWAVRIGQRVSRCSDDGEPSGTAGRPMLNTLDSMNLDEVCLAVVRYYGGIKLGSGGLCRAYSGAARELLQQIPLEEIRPTREVAVIVPTEFLGVTFHVLDSYGGKHVLEEFDEEHGNQYVVRFEVEEEKYDRVLDQLCESSRGNIREAAG